MIDCHLLRHGSTGFDGFRGRLDDALSPTGWQQMQHAALSYPWAALISSPRQRCLAFADQLSQQHNLPLRIDNNLCELDFGDWEGRTAADIASTDEQQLQNFWQDPWLYSPPGGESLNVFAQRIQHAWIQAQQEPAPLLIITHAGVIRYLHHWLTGSERSSLLHYPVPHGSLHNVTNWPVIEFPPA